MLFSPEQWRELIKPRLARLFAVFREADLPVILHSDGDIKAILPDLVDIGLTCLNPVQPEVLEHSWLQREFGQHLSFYGGLSTQDVLPRLGAGGGPRRHPGLHRRPGAPTAPVSSWGPRTGCNRTFRRRTWPPCWRRFPSDAR